MEIKRSPQRSSKKAASFEHIYKGNKHKIRWDKESKSIKLSVSNIGYPGRNDSRYAYEVFLSNDDVKRIIESLFASNS